MSRLQDDLREMEALVRAMLMPLRNRPLRLFIRAFTGCAVLPAPEHAPWLDALARALADAGKTINTKGFYSRRVNEVGTKIETFVLEALRKHGFQAEHPPTREGRKQRAGYPDLLVHGVQGSETPCFYLECKTFQPTASARLRTFYLSPPLAKITRDAMHLLVAYRIEPGREHERREGMQRYYAREWRLMDLYELRVDVKHEIQASNQALHALPILRRGEIA